MKKKDSDFQAWAAGSEAQGLQISDILMLEDGLPRCELAYWSGRGASCRDLRIRGGRSQRCRRSIGGRAALQAEVLYRGSEAEVLFRRFL